MAGDILSNMYIDETLTQDSGYTDERIPKVLRDKADYILVQRELGLEAISAIVDIGSGENGLVGVAVDEGGSDGNSYTIEVVIPEENSEPLAASIDGEDITVSLATDADGNPDDTENTATLVTAEIDDLDGVSAEASGDGSGVLSSEEGPKSFAGGVDSTEESDVHRAYQIIKTPNDDKYHFKGNIHHFIENIEAGSYFSDENVLSISLNGKWLRNY